ncbi:hypothetical protein GCM10011512_23430 [Tersicoccus solisilvae]|uniref:PIN domain-containing protein n=1 Tax=Tersicoccus solisilvae TaxID=1882339 RepID=A0ABQ1PEV1_9MICC|nr:hypothetical protein [Tersicoccus solisilvae]GGC95701.1 hypothetical protein GCM10011512_23430 [Tersicoccus solisilvae]
MKYLIIDANIARSCNDPADNADAASCFLFLQHVGKRENSTGVVVNAEIEREWDIHANRTFTAWYAKMERRSRVKYVDVKHSNDYRAIISAVDNDGVRSALQKDVHLVELALFGQHPVASRDDKQRRYVRSLIGQYSLLRGIQWVNPVTESGWDAWLNRGCDRDGYLLTAAE